MFWPAIIPVCKSATLVWYELLRILKLYPVKQWPCTRYLHTMPRKMKSEMVWLLRSNENIYNITENQLYHRTEQMFLYSYLKQKIKVSYRTGTVSLVCSYLAIMRKYSVTDSYINKYPSRKKLCFLYFESLWEGGSAGNWARARTRIRLLGYYAFRSFVVS